MAAMRLARAFHRLIEMFRPALPESPDRMINSAATTSRRSIKVTELAELLDLQDHPAVRDMIAKFEQLDPTAYWQAARQAEADRGDPDPELVEAIERRLEACVAAPSSARDASSGIATETELPYWQTEPCPVWCHCVVDGDGHPDEDGVPDRVHFSAWQGQVVLSLVDDTLDERRISRGWIEPEFANIHLIQHYREAQPRLWLGRSQTNEGWHMTSDEARALAEQLTKGADMADGR